MIKHESGEKKEECESPCLCEGDFFTDLLGQYWNGKAYYIDICNKILIKN